MTEDDLENELNECCKNIFKTKNSMYLNDFQRIISKALLDKKILCRSLIISCFNSLKNLIPSKYANDLLNKAIEINDVDLIVAYLNNVQIVTESNAFACLKFFIKLHTSDEEKQQISKSLENHLNLVFGINYDYNFLTKEFKKLSSNEFLLCLNYLKQLLKRYFGIEATSNPSLSKMNSNSSNGDLSEIKDEEGLKIFKSPDFLQVTELLSCFVDAHFTHITLSNEAQEIIADLLQMVESQVDLFSDVISIESLINETKSKSNQKIDKVFDNNQGGGNYYIEILKLK